MGLGSGDAIDVRNNPLSDTSLNTYIPALQSRGVEVQFGSSKPAVVEKETRMPSNSQTNSSPFLYIALPGDQAVSLSDIE